MKASSRFMSHPMVYVIIAVILFVAVNIISGLGLKRFGIDFTEDNIFSLSEGSYTIIEQSNEPITLRFFFSNKLANGYPAIKAYASRIVALLEEYEALSDGKFTLQIIDPEPLSDDEDLAISYGLKGAPVDNQGTQIYFGLVATNSVDESRLIPIFTFDREAFIEYDLSRIIHDLSGSSKPTVGVISALPIDTPSFMGVPGLGGAKSWIILEQLRQLFNVIPVGEDATTIPSEVDVLMIAQPKALTDDALYAIDQFVLKGGRAVMFLDPNAENKDGSSPTTDAGFDTKITTLLDQWGIEVATRHIIGDRNAARKVVSLESESGRIDYIGWLSMRQQNLNEEHIITSSLKTLNFGSAGYVSKKDSADIDFQPLVTTSERSMKIPVSHISGTPDPKKLLSQFISDNQGYHLAASISGMVDSAFPDKASEEGHVASASSPINLVIVADTDLLRDQTWASAQNFEGYRIVVPSADNANFVTNAIDYMGGSRELISLRGRAGANRPFDVVEALKREAEEQYLEKETLLKDNLAKTEQKLSELQRMGRESTSNALIYQAQQEREIKRFTQQLIDDKKELRRVQHSLREGIDALGSRLKFINIGLMPLCVVFFAIGYAVLRSRKQRTV